MNKKNLLIVLGVMALIGGSATAWKFLHKPSVEEVALANKKMFTQIEKEGVDNFSGDAFVDVSLEVKGMEELDDSMKDGEISAKADGSVEYSNSVLHLKANAKANALGEKEDAEYEIWADNEYLYTSEDGGKSWVRSEMDSDKSIEDSINEAIEEAKEKSSESKEYDEKDMKKSLKDIKENIKNGTYTFEAEENKETGKSQWVLTMPVDLSEIEEFDDKQIEQLNELGVDADSYAEILKELNLSGTIDFKMMFNKRTYYIEGMSIEFSDKAMKSINKSVNKYVSEYLAGLEMDDVEMSIEIKKAQVGVNFYFDSLKELTVPNLEYEEEEVDSDWDDSFEEDDYDETSEISTDDLTNELKLGKESFSLEDVSVEDVSKYSGLSINEEYTEDDEIVYFGDDLGIAVYTENGVVNGITVDVGEYNDFNFYGVTAQSSYEDLVEILGKENSSYSDDDFSAYTWEIGNMNINVSYDGKDMYSVEIIKY